MTGRTMASIKYDSKKIQVLNNSMYININSIQFFIYVRANVTIQRQNIN
jgi:hypothetical protein